MRAPIASTMSSALLPQPLAVIRTKSGQLPLRAQPTCTPRLRSCSFVCWRQDRSLRSLTLQTSPQRRRITAVRFVRCWRMFQCPFWPSLKASHPPAGAVEHRHLVQTATLLREMELVLLLRYVCCAQHSQLLAS